MSRSDMLPRKPIGAIFADVILRGPGGVRTQRLMVDTGATYTWVPEALARELGARVRRTLSVRLGDGRIVERTMGELEVEIHGRTGTVPLVFGIEDDVSVVGVTTLEILLLEPDPVTGNLRPAPYALLLIA